MLFVQCFFVKVKLLSRVHLFAIPWTVAYQAPPSMGFSRQEYWSGLPFPSPGNLPYPGIEPWCWEGLGAGVEGDDRGWDGWMALRTRWTWVWVNSGRWWWTGRPGVLQFMGLQSQTRLSDWTKLNWKTHWMCVASLVAQTVKKIGFVFFILSFSY